MFFIAMFWFITKKKKNLKMVCLASSASGVKLSVHRLQRPESREGFRGQGPSQGAFTLPVPVPVMVNTSSRWHKESGVPCLTCPGTGGCVAEGAGWCLELFQDDGCFLPIFVF